MELQLKASQDEVEKRKQQLKAMQKEELALRKRSKELEEAKATFELDSQPGKMDQGTGREFRECKKRRWRSNG